MKAEEKLRMSGARLLPYATERLKSGKTLVTGFFGGWTLLSDEDLASFAAGDYDRQAGLMRTLKESGIVVDESNLQQTAELYRGLNRSMMMQPSLHMINVTNTCNYRCKYCHAGVSQGKDFMSPETALKALSFIFRSSGRHFTIEFQGGECLLNWKVVKLVVEKARELNKVFKKDMHICIVSNLSLLTEEKLEFLTDHDVAICTSLDGTEEIHDLNRRTVTGKDTHAVTLDKIRMAQEYFKRRGLPGRKVDVLATITRPALSHPREIVDTYLKLGIHTVHLRPLHNFGDALSSWDTIAYTPEEFYAFWVEAMEYIFDLNKRGTDIMERGAFNIACRLLAKRDPLYVELMSPTGMGRTALLYNFDGGIYNSDEGRMLKEPVFRIGTVEDDLQDVLGGEANMNIWASSCLELMAYDSPYRPWGGVHPVKVYQDQGTIIPNIRTHSEFRIYEMQCRYLFEKLSLGGPEKDILMRWTERSIK